MHYESQLINLLLVESEQHTRELFHQYLDDTKLHLNMTEVSSGEEAIEAFKHSTFDCILLDNELDDMNGQMVLSFIQDGPNLAVPVIIFSDEIETGLDLELLESGAVEFIPQHLCNALLLRRAILYSLVRRQYIKSQQEYLNSQKELYEQQYWHDEENRLEALKSEKEHAEAANRAKSKFLSNMSHELRTPLNAILGFAQLLMFKSKKPLSDYQHDNVNEIIKAGNHLLSLINDVLDLSKIEAGKIGIKKEKLAVAEVIEECIKLTADLAMSRAINISRHCENTHLVYADHTRFKQVILNLLSNAIKYNRPKGAVNITCSYEQKGMMTITVSDTGIGIAKDDFGDVFQPFSRLHSNNSAIEGTGIGLTLSRRLVEEMDGEIGFESESGVGSRFWISIPLVEDLKTTVSKGVATQRFLYINGNLDQLLEVKSHWNSHCDIELMTTDILDVAFKLSKRKPPNLVIVDLAMLSTSLVETIELLRTSDALVKTQVIAISSDITADEVNEGLKAGFDQILIKPLSIDQVIELACGTLSAG